jgi:hypothetical protein
MEETRILVFVADQPSSLRHFARIAWSPIRHIVEYSERHKANGHWHAYYAIPAFLGFTLTYLMLQIGQVYYADVYWTTHGYHVHHYTYGIVLLLVFGYVGIWSQSIRVKYFCALIYGISAALIIDEARIWFTLNPAPGYQDYDLAFYVGAFLLGIVLSPILFAKRKQP